MILLVSSSISAGCPWVVKPLDSDPIVDARDYRIYFDSLNFRAPVSYGFTVTSVELAWEILNQGRLPPLEADARRLQAIPGLEWTTFRISQDTIKPYWIYLVGASSPIDSLERIGARIEPSTNLHPFLRGFSVPPKDRDIANWSETDRGPLGIKLWEQVLDRSDAANGEQPIALALCAYKAPTN